MQEIDKIQEEIIDEFSLMDDWADKYRYIIEIGQAGVTMKDEDKLEERKIKGCQSNVWLKTDMQGSKLHFEADSDALITKGLVNLLIRVWSDQSPASILDSDLYFIDEIGMKEHLSPTRANGLSSMIKQMKVYALAYKEKSSLES